MTPKQIKQMAENERKKSEARRKKEQTELAERKQEYPGNNPGQVIVVWWSNRAKKRDDLHEFAGYEVQHLELSRRYYNDNGKPDKKHKELFDSITENALFYARISPESKMIEHLENIGLRLPLDTRNWAEEKMLPVNGFSNDMCNYGLRFGKFSHFEKDSFHWMHFFSKQPSKEEFTLKLPQDLIKCLNTLQEKSIEQMSGKCHSFKAITKWRLVVGLGVESVYETGMTFHPVYGFPYIPASAVKGVVRSWIIGEVFNKSEENAWKSRLFCDLFGCEKTSEGYYKNEARKGRLEFFDVYPEGKITVEPDVMTPHYGDYYGEKKDKNGNPVPPADYLSPVPVFFLTVKNTAFVFRFGLREKFNSTLLEYGNDPLACAGILIDKGRLKLEKESTITEAIMVWMKDALQYHGIGAKTSVGYGRISI